MTTHSAQSILRSRNTASGDVVSTLVLRYPRCIHAEFMTHRMFSRNAASSRAIPVAKLIQDVMENPFIPVHWGKNQKGMQAEEECNNGVLFGNDYLTHREEAWLTARNRAVEAAQAFDAAGYHKQIVNRLLEPFAHITVLVSSTTWDNFLELRDHKDAEPHIQILAREVRKVLDEAPIQDLAPGEWHTPFVTDGENTKLYGDEALKLSVARCASTSYKTVDGFDMDLDRAVAIYDRLVGSRPLHASPLEHVCQADLWHTWSDKGWDNQHEHGNFTGFRQLRKQVENGST